MARTELRDENALFSRVASALEGRYTILRELGRGGMATVYLADDARHGRKVAVKILHPELTATVGADRFEREIRIAASLTHPHILSLHDSGAASGTLYYVMPFIEGASLRDLLEREHELKVDAAATLTREILDALGYAHGQGFVHRDIKPENILLAGGHALVSDFGIARVAGPTTTAITDSGLVVGSPSYMSPEQGAGEATIDGRSDLYSVGCVLFEMLVGVAPYSGTTAMRILSRHAVDPIPSVRAMRGDVGPALDGVVARAMAKNPEDRFPSALAFRVALDAATGESNHPRTTPPTAFSFSAPPPPAGAATAPRGSSGVPRQGDSAATGSVAVLPFEDLSLTRDQEYLCDGITEDLRSALARVKGLRVASRTSTLGYRGRAIDARDVGRELNVASVLEGTVQRAGDRLRVSASLTGTSDGVQLWSERYERDVSDIFALQDEIGRSVVDSLQITLSAQQPALVPRTTKNLEAYQLYLRGRHLWGRREEGGLQKAVECFREAMELDPLYVMPYVGFADAFNTFGAYEYLPPREAFPRVIAAAQRALEIDPTLAESHTALGSALAHYQWRWKEAEGHFREALGLNPQYALGQAYYALMCSATGRHERARDAVARAQQLDPMSHIFSPLVGWVAFFARRLDDAIHQFQMAIEMESNMPIVHSFLGFAYLAADRVSEAVAAFEVVRNQRSLLGSYAHALGRAGRIDEARAVLAEMDRRAQHSYISDFSRSLVHLGWGDHDTALDYLERALEERPYLMSYLAVHPVVDPLRSEPRFATILERMALHDVPGAITPKAD
jgi:eukaryotic-like serine/threonine-protein kinase